MNTFMHQKPVIEQLCLLLELKCLRSLLLLNHKMFTAFKNEKSLQIAADACEMYRRPIKACMEGRLDIVCYLHENGLIKDNALPFLDFAALSGNLELVQWLQDNLKHYSNVCTCHAMNFAAKRGDVRMLEWFHRNRTEGCSNLALYWAAQEGHVNAAKWLLANYKTSCSIDEAILCASKFSQFEIARWLTRWRCEQRKILPTA
jgi:hypothetical protein